MFLNAAHDKYSAKMCCRKPRG